MATEQALTKITLVAGADLSAKQFTFVTYTAAAGVTSPTAITAPIVGVLLNTPKLGEAAEIAIGGETKVVFNAAVASGPVSTAIGGKAVTAEATSYVLGIVTQPVTAANSIGAILFNQMGIKA